jgi:hypothetical protein
MNCGLPRARFAISPLTPTSLLLADALMYYFYISLLCVCYSMYHPLTSLRGPCDRRDSSVATSRGDI